MAKGLETLIRLNEWSVDQKRRKLNDLSNLIHGFKAELEKLEQDLINERAVAVEAPNEGGYLYGYYIDRVIDRRSIIQISIKQLEKDSDGAREELSEAYRELKKYKTALDARRAGEKAELAKEEQTELDEVAIGTFNQKRI
mgnify:CR=1 FL=1